MSRSRIEKQNLPAIGYAILTMLLVIIAYDQLLFRPVVAWADKFRFEQTASATAPTSWMLDLFRRTRALRALTYPFAALNKAISNLHIALPSSLRMPAEKRPAVAHRRCALACARSSPAPAMPAWRAYQYLSATLSPSDVVSAVRIWLDHAAARHRADRAGDADLGAGRGLDRAAAETRRAHPAAGAVSGGVSGQPRISRCSW